MASYTIIQNVEAEDKIIGPLSVKKLFWALLAAALCWLAWYLGSHISYYLIIPFALVTPIFIFLALPLERDQPNDVWLAAQLNFIFRPKKRLWCQMNQIQAFSLIKEAYEEGDNAALTDDHTPAEALSKINNLSHILDSRGAYLEELKDQSEADEEGDALEAEHENRDAALNQRFQSLLRVRGKGYKQSVHHNLKQNLRAQQSHHLDLRSNPPLNQTPAPKLKEAVSKISSATDLKISTLEKMVRNLKHKHSLKADKLE